MDCRIAWHKNLNKYECCFKFTVLFAWIILKYITNSFYTTLASTLGFLYLEMGEQGNIQFWLPHSVKYYGRTNLQWSCTISCCKYYLCPLFLIRHNIIFYQTTNVRFEECSPFCSSFHGSCRIILQKNWIWIILQCFGICLNLLV